MRLVVCNKVGKKAPEYKYDDAVGRLNPHNFEDGLLYRINQSPKDNTLVGKELIVFSVKGDVSRGLLRTIQPTRVRYVEKELLNKFISLRTVSEDKMFNYDWWQDIVMYVYSTESKDKAISVYNNMIETYKIEREAYLLEQIKKELRPHSKRQVKGLL